MELAHYMGPLARDCLDRTFAREGRAQSRRDVFTQPRRHHRDRIPVPRGSYAGRLVTKPILSEVKPDTGGADWRVQTIWPLKQPCVVSYLESDFSAALVARDACDYVWILSRNPHMESARPDRYPERIANMSYDLARSEVFARNGDPPWKLAL